LNGVNIHPKRLARSIYFTKTKKEIIVSDIKTYIEGWSSAR